MVQYSVKIVIVTSKKLSGNMFWMGKKRCLQDFHGKTFWKADTWKNDKEMMLICLREITFGNVMRFNYESFQTLKIQNGWEGKGNHCCEGGNTVMSSILPFSFVFAFKETSGWPEVSWRWRGEKNKVTAHVSTCWRMCRKNLNIISMCAVSPVVHTSNISSCQKNFFSFPVAVENSIR